MYSLAEREPCKRYQAGLAKITVWADTLLLVNVRSTVLTSSSMRAFLARVHPRCTAVGGNGRFGFGRQPNKHFNASGQNIDEHG
ncbi:MAG TPA: hypothetical protein DDW52_12640 [Planctomycetaceae bacterium]|nr:hypothetical protein [Planctomycetaceae bacterium]